MTNYVFIESRDPFESRDTQFVEETAIALKQRGHEVTVFLVQNGVFASRRNIRDSALSRMAKAGVNLLADDFSLCERGISLRANSNIPESSATSSFEPAELQAGVQPTSIETLVAALVQENTKAIWH
jgi:sulfur relay (sulfurtransferase) complex TusBCD TusD component (DsrE family)